MYRTFEIYASTIIWTGRADYPELGPPFVSRETVYKAKVQPLFYPGFISLLINS